jgi:hypothetical protein
MWLTCYFLTDRLEVRLELSMAKEFSRTDLDEVRRMPVADASIRDRIEGFFLAASNLIGGLVQVVPYLLEARDEQEYRRHQEAAGRAPTASGGTGNRATNPKISKTESPANRLGPFSFSAGKAFDIARTTSCTY